MSDFVQFALTISKYKIRDPTDIFPLEKIPIILNVNGYFMLKTKIHVERVIPSLQMIQDIIPHISEGPQPQLAYFYSRVKCLSGVMVSSAKQMDQGIPEHLRCTNKVLLALGHLSQFEHYLRELISPKAATLTSYIPSFNDCIRTVISIFRKLIEQLQEVEEYLIPESEVKNGFRIDYSRRPIAQTAASLLFMAEEVSIDLNFLLQNEKIKNSSKRNNNNQLIESDEEKLLKFWIATLNQVSASVFANVGAIEEETNLNCQKNDGENKLQFDKENSYPLIKSVSPVISASPSLLATIRNIYRTIMTNVNNSNEKNVFTESSEFSKVLSDSILYMYLTNIIDASAPINFAKSILSNIPSIYKSHDIQKANSLNSEATTLFNIIMPRVKASMSSSAQSSLLSNESNEIAEQGAIRDMLTYSGSKTETACLAAVMVARFYAASASSDLEASEEILIQVGKTANEVLTIIFGTIIQIAQSVQKTIREHMSDFNEKQLGELNYYSVNLIEVGILSMDDTTSYCGSLKKVISYFGALPTALRKIELTCSNPNTKKTIHDLATSCEDITEELACWTHIVLLSFSTLVIIHSELSDTTFNFCQWGASPNSSLYLSPAFTSIMKKMPDDLTKLSIELHGRLANSNTTKFLSYDIGQVSLLINTIKQLDAPYNSFNKLVTSGQGETASYDLLLSIISYAIPIITKPLPEYVNSISVFLEFKDIDSFASFMNGAANLARKTINKAGSQVPYHPLSLASLCSIPISQLSSSFSAIKQNQQYAASLAAIQESASAPINTIWNISTGISSGQRPITDANLIMQQIKNLDSILSQISSTVDSIAVPNLPLVNEGSAKLISDIQARASGKSGTFKDLIESILDTFKLFESPDADKVLEDLSKYMTEIDAIVRDGKSGTPVDLINAFTKRLADSINDLLNGRVTDPSALIDSVMAISASLAAVMENCGEPFLSELQRLHNEMIDNLRKYMASGGNDREALRRLIANAESINAITRMIKMNERERNEFFGRSMNNLMRGLNGIRTNSAGINEEVIINSIRALEDIMVASKMFKCGSPDLPQALEPLRNMLFTGKFNNDVISKIIARLSQEISNYRGFSYEQISTINSIESALDFIYAKAELFRTYSSKLLRRVTLSSESRSKSMNEGLNEKEQINDDKTKQKSMTSVSAASALNLDAQNIELDELCDYLRVMESSITLGAGVTFRSLVIAALKEKPIAAHTINTYGEMTEVSALLVPDVIDMNNKLNINQLINTKDQKDQITNLRRFIRKMTKEFDSFITIIESPNSNKNQLKRDDEIAKECQNNKNDFESLKMKVIAAISDLSNEVGSMNWLATNSFSPEMYNDGRARITNKITNQFNVLIQAGQAVLLKAVGDSASLFGKTLNETRNELQKLIEDAQYVDFSKNYPAERIVDQTGKVGTVLIKLNKYAMDLIDHIVVKADPIAAGKLPDDYVLPTASSFSLSSSSQSLSSAETLALLEQTMDSLRLSSDSVSLALDKIIKITSDPASTNDDILEALNNLKATIDKLIEDSMKVTVIASNDPLVQISLQNTLHSLASSFTAVKEALRSRFMRASNYQSEMNQAVTDFRASMQASMKAAEDASQAIAASINASSQKSAAKDAVTRELEATANAIEEMTRRLKAIEQSQQAQMSQNATNGAAGGSSPATGYAGANSSAIPGSLAGQPLSGTASTTGSNGSALSAGGPGLSAAGDGVLNDGYGGDLSAFVIQNANPILAAAAMILKRAQEITNEMLAKYGKIENEQLLIRSAKELSDAAALLIFSAEIVMNGVNEESIFKVIAAAKIVKASVCALVAQVLVKGGDPQQIMDRHVRTVIQHTDMIIKRAEVIVLQIFEDEEKKVKMAPTLMAQKLNLQSRIAQVRKKLQEEEKALYKFRKRF